MIHFFIAYLMLKYILFKPALKIVFLQEERLLQVNHDIVLLKNTVAQELGRQKQQQIAWAHRAIGLKPEFGGCEFQSFPLMPIMRLAINREEQEDIVRSSVHHIVGMLSSQTTKGKL